MSTETTESTTSKPGTIAKLALALSKAQGQMGNALKDSLNPAFKSKYADLASCWDAIRKPFSDNELAVLQFVRQEDDKRVSIETQLHHSSGEFVSNTITIPVAQHSAHGVLTAITYARRGGLCAIAGIAPEDDDGNTASGIAAPSNGHHNQPSRSSSRPTPPASTPPSTPAADYGPDGAPISDGAKLEVKLEEAQDQKDLDGLTTGISDLKTKAPTWYTKLRARWGERQKEFAAKASAPQTEAAESGSAA